MALDTSSHMVSVKVDCACGLSSYILFAVFARLTLPSNDGVTISKALAEFLALKPGVFTLMARVFLLLFVQCQPVSLCRSAVPW